MIKFLFLAAFLLIAVQTAYSPAIAKKLVIASNIAFASESEINKWSCQ